MVLNKQKGNMYGFVTDTWNTHSGRCSHGCSYCFNLGKPYFEGELRLMEKNFNDNLGEGNFIFVGSSNDLFAQDVPDEWIKRTLEHCRKYNNKYLFQSKNVTRMFSFIRYFPSNYIVGTTLESNRDYEISNAPKVRSRLFSFVNDYIPTECKMVTIEPILDFDLDIFVDWIKQCKPKWVNIGADSKGHKLPEPSPEKINALITELKKFTEVKIKPNLKRLRGESIDSSINKLKGVNIIL